MDLIEQVLGIAIFIAITLGLIMLSGASDVGSSLEDRVARGDLTEDQYRRILLARLGTL